ncbi:MAG TPA: histidine phosphatase family protein [Roseiflexaceae bacterium]|nr:histidine phosphatase family protein [Roseiflexaceae bacterium]
MTVFYLIRHGETAWNALGRWQGHTDVPLSPVGEEQARRVAERLKTGGTRFAALYSSDLQRAWATAETIGAALGLAPQPVPDLRELDIGWWGGLTNAEIRERDPETTALVERGEDPPRGGAECWADLRRRAGAAVERLAQAHPDQALLLVTHGGVVRAVLNHVTAAAPQLAAPKHHIGNTSITVVVRTPEGWDIGVVNDMSHLEGSPQAPDMLSAPPDDATRV